MDNQKEYSRYMSNFRGVDTTSEASNVALNRFSFIQNMYKDYKSGQGVAIETFPGTRTLCKNLGGKIYGIHTYKVSSDKVYIIVHAGKKLYYFDKDKRDELSTDLPTEFSGITMKEAKSSSFVCNNRLYIIDGEHYITVYEDEDDTGNKILKTEHVDNDTAYVPTTFSNVSQYEQRNMLTNKFIEKTRLEKLVSNTNVTIKQSTGSLLCPVISHQADYHSLYGYYRCLCGSIDANNDFKVFGFVAEKGINSVEIDFNQVKIDWETCNKKNPRYYRVKKEKELNGVFFDDIIDVPERPNFHAETNETITIGELKARYDKVEETDEADIYQYEFYRNISETYLDLESDAERRKLLDYVRMEDNVTEVIGTLSGCSNLSIILLSNNIETLAADFFAGTAIETAYLPYYLKSFEGVTDEKKPFNKCNNLKTIYASSTIYDKLSENREKYGIGEDVEIISYESRFMSGVPNMTPEEDEDRPVNRVYIRTPCEDVASVRINGGEISKATSKPEKPENPSLDTKETLYYPIYKFIGGKEYVIAIEFYHLRYVTVTDSIGMESVEPGGETEVNGTVEIHGEAHPSVFTTTEEATEEAAGTSKDAITAHENYSGDAITAIKHCTVCCAFDGRIFFTGNPDLPNTVFYTQRDLTGHNNPTYVGVLNWFDDGIGNTPNVAMMSNASTLVVLKGNTMQDGSIYYHTGADGGNDLTPRIYPSVEGLAGLGCVGMAVNFRDDCVFMSDQGLEAIAKQTVNLERTIEHRSTNIDGLMLRSNLSLARAAEWEGYLCILIDGKMFLADSRQAFEGIGGAMEYEWYYVADVCGYDGDNQKYFLADYTPANVQIPTSLTISVAEDRSVNYEDVRSIQNFFYIIRDGESLLVGSSGERENGTPDMACEICAVEDVLLFGTKDGRLLCLNNDKRGTNDNDPDKSRIPAEWYNNSGHAYIARAVLAMENAGVPHYTKTTVKRGTVLRLKSFEQSAFDVYATTDRQATTLLTSQSNSVTTFDALDFENLGLLTADSGILAIKEKTKKWVEKQYEFRNDKPNQPFGIYSIAYRYIISGEVKNK